MRSLLLGLLLLNFLYWGWSKWIAEEGQTTPAFAEASGLPGLEFARDDVGYAALVSTPASEKNDEQVSADLLATVQIETATPTAAADTNSDEESLEGLGSPDVTEAGSASIDADTTTKAPVTEIINEPLGRTATAAGAELTEEAVLEEASTTTSLEPTVEMSALISADPVSSPRRCVSVGPFLNLEQASEAESLMSNSGLTTKQRGEESEVWVGHWVFLPAYPSRSAAVAAVEKLREEGVKDIYIEPSGALKNTVSLGLFTDMARAEIRAGRVRRLGVRPQIQDRKRDGLVYWVDTQLEAGFEVDISAFNPIPNQDLQVRKIECESTQLR